MPKQEAPLHQLKTYLPEGSFDDVFYYLQHYKVHLTITKERKSVLGDYRHATLFKAHRISINSNLNPYAFLITLIHELAHLVTFIQFGTKVMAHGKEWKIIYGQMLQQFVAKKIFPADIESELLHSLKNPAASSCAEDGLLRVLRKYDAKKSVVSNHTGGYRCLVEELVNGSLFRISDGRIFEKGPKLRKRFKCKEVKNGKFYLFSPVYEVEQV